MTTASQAHAALIKNVKEGPHARLIQVHWERKELLAPTILNALRTTAIRARKNAWPI